MSKGIVYCVGVGCGDPELMTLKSLRIIRENQIIAVVGEHYENSLAYNIALQNVPQLKQKTILSLPMPMTTQKDIIHKYHCQNTHLIENYLDSGDNVVCLTLGDPSVYSSLYYLRTLLQNDGYTVQSISGVTSFCEVANILNISLSEQNGEIHILPSLYQNSFPVLSKGSLVIMKPSKNISSLKSFIFENNLFAWAIENCGFQNQKIYYGAENFPDTFPYFTVVIIRYDVTIQSLIFSGKNMDFDA